MADVCGDNRFEIIEAVKKRLIESTNITTSPKEMEVIDSLLLRMWQLGYLKDNNVKHATWVVSKKYKPWYTCSACEDCYVDGEWVEGHKWSYCPNCGAIMDGKVE